MEGYQNLNKNFKIMVDFSLKHVIIKFIDANWKLLYIVFMTFFTIIIITCNLIAKKGWDLFPIIMIVWLLCSIYIPKHSTTPSRAFIILVFFVFLDGLIDSLSTGQLKWIGWPWILGYWFHLYPVVNPTHPITAIYLVTLWIFAIPYRSLTIGAYFVTNYYNVDFNERPQRFEKFFDKERKKIVLFFLTGGAIVISLICDWFNFLIRPQIPEFYNYVPPLGFWTIERMAIRTALVLIIAAYCFYLAVREKETKGSLIIILFIIILILYLMTFLIALF